VALISVGLVANLLTIALWLLIVLASAAVAVRAANVAVQHRRTKPHGPRRARRARSLAR
jgi:hypothetical protein